MNLTLRLCLLLVTLTGIPPLLLFIVLWPALAPGQRPAAAFATLAVSVLAGAAALHAAWRLQAVLRHKLDDIAGLNRRLAADARALARQQELLRRALPDTLLSLN